MGRPGEQERGQSKARGEPAVAPPRRVGLWSRGREDVAAGDIDGGARPEVVGRHGDGQRDGVGQDDAGRHRKSGHEAGKKTLS